MIGPASACEITYGTIWQKATRPVLPTLPVVVRTNQGRAMDNTRLADRAAALADSMPTRPRRTLGCASGTVVRAPLSAAFLAAVC